MKPIKGLKFVKNNSNNIDRLFKNLRHNKYLHRSDVVYSVPSINSNNVYIGKTSSSLQLRINSHGADIKLNKHSSQLAIPANSKKQPIKKRTFLEITHIYYNFEHYKYT